MEEKEEREREELLKRKRETEIGKRGREGE